MTFELFGTMASNGPVIPGADECGALAGETKVLGEKPTPISLCPPQMPYELLWD